MIEKIRISLWDIFTFFMTGVFFVIIILGFITINNQLPQKEVIFDFLIKLPATYILVVMPIILILLGLLIEPIANFFERYIGKYLFFWIKINEDKRKIDKETMEKYIKENSFGDLNNKIENPFMICKEYVETKQLSTTFMVFLSRYGFYRNCSFIILLFGVVCFLTSSFSCISFLGLIVSYLSSGLLKKRADEFYSYQATTVYSAFLIDNLNWPSKKSSENK
ncbi:hypothetical protein ACS7D5_16330 [Proteus mirabilis]|uniref:hypothetical protein n=2 Tax=Proteus mirabilis TaxID=584 RepID=UPI000D7470FF|nr:hypothetical protein [Proteus mirabilis]AWR58724.1 hypothetical protein CLH65_04915 [Proteus mirabilis]MBI6474254.1 hypothetical protein [Proteus mirabilis]MCI9778737.1 hypothetical protein [Proteus mirabilis]MCU9586850.1 hypothetical protein [Proteus mirabilis]HEI8564516.1 hypothetical protein [Proteus mirabilis]